MNVNAQKKSPVKAAKPTTENTEAKPSKQWIGLQEK